MNKLQQFLTPADLRDRIIAADILNPLLAGILSEDLGSSGDITSRALIASEATCSAAIVCRKSGVAAGFDLLSHFSHPLIDQLCGSWNFNIRDGDIVDPGRKLAEITARLQPLLALERSLLNFLGHLSGIATSTRRFVDAVSGTTASICDTRKTTPAPGMRLLEKYAVGCGGGIIHRLGLYDAVLIKDNHLACLPTADVVNHLTTAIYRVRETHQPRFVEVEVDTLDQLERILTLPAGQIDIIMLDNMPLPEMIQAVEMRNLSDPKVLLEASGGVTLETVRAIAETGVDRIAVGEITHSAPWLDIGLDIEP